MSIFFSLSLSHSQIYIAMHQCFCAMLQGPHAASVDAAVDAPVAPTSSSIRIQKLRFPIECACWQVPRAPHWLSWSS